MDVEFISKATEWRCSIVDQSIDHTPIMMGSRSQPFRCEEQLLQPLTTRVGERIENLNSISLFECGKAQPEECGRSIRSTTMDIR
jgi:hypothetical protein